MSVVFLDCETTGLDPERHEIWELAYIIDRKETRFLLYPDLSLADSFALSVGKFYDRCANWATGEGFDSTNKAARRFVADVKGRHLVGAVPSFDDAFLKKWMGRERLPVTWHYHLVDVEALAAGKIGMAPPWDSEELSRAVGVDPGQFERHTAAGDAWWARAIYLAVLGDIA